MAPYMEKNTFSANVPAWHLRITLVAECADKPHPARLLGSLIGNRLASFAVTNPVASEMRSVNSPTVLWLLSDEQGPMCWFGLIGVICSPD